MARTEVLDVRINDAAPDALAGFHLDAPTPGSRAEDYALDLCGWTVGRRWGVQRIEAWLGDRVLRDAGVWLKRPDVAEQLRHLPATGWSLPLRRCLGWFWPGARAPRFGNDPAASGFHLVISVLGLPLTFTLDLVAVLGDGRRVPVARLRGRREPVTTAHTPRRQPIILRHLGRSGSTWLARLLSEHPDIVVHRRHPFETFVAVHALRLLQVVTTPSGPVQHGAIKEMTHGLARVGAAPLHCAAEDARMHRWLRREYVERHAAFCTQTIDAFYDEVARGQAKAGAAFWCEKFFQFPLVADLCAELYPGHREVFLVRDFRDVACSRTAWQAAPGGRRLDEVLERTARDGRALVTQWHQRQDRAHLVRYEELVPRPEDALRPLFDHLGVAADAQTVAGVIQRATQDSQGMKGHRTSASPEQSLGRWKRERPHRGWAALRDPLEAFGYAA